MLGPILVDLATEFNTSIAVAGQLASATYISWAITAPLVGPVSDTYGRRLVALTGLMLTAIGVLGSVLAVNFALLVVFRLLTGVGAAMIVPNGIAAAVDRVPPAMRGKVISWMLIAGMLASIAGVPIVAILTDAGGWRLPFYVVGAVVLALWGLLWMKFPRSQPSPDRSFSFVSRFKEVGSNATFWYVLCANFLVQTAFFGLITYLAAYLVETHDMKVGQTALPLAIVGAGGVMGAFAGGGVTESAHRRLLVTFCVLIGGLLVGLAFIINLSPWASVALFFGGLGLLLLEITVLGALIMELSGGSRGTAAGMFTFSIQLGGVTGASVGGLLVSLGGFSLLGIFCLGTASASAATVWLKVPDSPEFRQRVASRQQQISGREV